MIAESNEKLPALEESRGKVLFRFDYKVVERLVENGKPERIYQFNQIEISLPVDRSRLIDAVISSVYSKSDEIALINNKAIDEAKAAEYTRYQAFRSKAKSIVDEAL